MTLIADLVEQHQQIFAEAVRSTPEAIRALEKSLNVKLPDDLIIFSAGARQEAFSLPAEKLAQAFEAGSVSVVALEGVVGRVLSEAMQGAVNDPSAGAVPARVAC